MINGTRTKVGPSVSDYYSDSGHANSLISQGTVNIDKASAIKEDLTISNTSGSAQQIFDILGLPNYFDSALGRDSALMANTSVGNPEFTQLHESAFVLGYHYPSTGSNYVTTYSNQENVQNISVANDPTGGLGYESLADGNKLSISVPLGVINPNSHSKQFAQIDNGIVLPSIGELYSSVLQLNLVHSITAKAFNDANYNSLWSSTNKGVASLYDADGNTVSDVTKATVKSVTPMKDPSEYTVVYSYDGVDSNPVTAKIADQTFIDAKDFTVNYGSNWDSQKFNGLTKHLDQNGQAVTKLSDDVNVTIQLNGKTVNAVDTNNAGAVYDVTYTAGNNAASKTVKVTVGQRGNIPSNNNSNNNNSTTNNNGNSGNSAWNPSNPSNPNGTGLPNYAAVKGSAVYATKGIYMYRSANFTKSQRTATYPKAKRVNRPMFVVLGYDKSNGGALRYKVRDVNHGKKTAGKIGYITANPKYVVNVYYKTMPKSHKITVINKKGIHAYKNVNLTGRVKTFKKGTHVTVKSFEKHNLTTRYKLSNGTYITANKKLVIQGNY